ncbi:SDR family oxidoreductase [Sphingomonas sp. SRS2]|uniref:SDR family oxidoreductase n=1 Tax=Sphingomonas sp. SRS2 TaxID=133190 RepID=UPI000A6B2743|nr:NAD(P)H-binding protein [Sphingomonas sp. SRS2]
MANDSVLIFGAAGHISLPLARWIRYKSPETRLRLVSRSADQRQRLQVEFPDAEVISADYLDPASMAAALEGVSAAFIVTPDFLDEQRAMEILCAEAKSTPTLRQIVRILGNLPYTKLGDIPEKWRSVGGTLTQHHVARAVLDGSGLPVTYLNMPAYLMDDLVRWSGPIREHSVLLMPYDRRHSWVDPAEVGQAAANIILSRDDRHIGQYYDVESGYEVLRFGDVANMLSDVLHRQIDYNDSPETWRSMVGSRYRAMFGDHGDEYFLAFYHFEQTHEFSVRNSNVLETLLGRPPTSLRSWMMCNANAVLPR